MTGSRIKRRDMETTGRITIIDAAAISASGALSIDSLLQQLTVTGAAASIDNYSAIIIILAV